MKYRTSEDDVEAADREHTKAWCISRCDNGDFEPLRTVYDHWHHERVLWKVMWLKIQMQNCLLISLVRLSISLNFTVSVTGYYVDISDWLLCRRLFLCDGYYRTDYNVKDPKFYMDIIACMRHWDDFCQPPLGGVRCYCTNQVAYLQLYDLRH